MCRPLARFCRHNFMGDTLRMRHSWVKAGRFGPNRAAPAILATGSAISRSADIFAGVVAASSGLADKNVGAPAAARGLGSRAPFEPVCDGLALPSAQSRRQVGAPPVPGRGAGPKGTREALSKPRWAERTREPLDVTWPRLASTLAPPTGYFERGSMDFPSCAPVRPLHPGGPKKVLF